MERVLQVTGDGNTYVDGQTVTIEDAFGNVRRFEFDSNNSLVNPSATRIPFTTGLVPTTAIDMANQLYNAINGSGLSVTATQTGTRITLTGERVTLLSGIVVAEARVSLAGIGPPAPAGKPPRLAPQDGPLLITHWGLSGPAILRLSAWGARWLHTRQYQATVQVNWLYAQKKEQVQVQEQAKVQEQVQVKEQSGDPIMTQTQTKTQNHGEVVSETAKQTQAGPGKGEAVSTQAKMQGEGKKQAKPKKQKAAKPKKGGTQAPAPAPGKGGPGR